MATSLYFVDDIARVSPTAGAKANSAGTLPRPVEHTNHSQATNEGVLSAFWGGDGNPNSRVIASRATTTQQSHYFGRFSSRPLKAQTIPAQTWNWQVKVACTNASANTFLWPIMYVWRPGTGIVGSRIFDANANASTEWPTTVGTPGARNLASAVAVTCQDGDILVVELWAMATQGAATSYNQTWVTTSNLSKIVSPYDIQYIPETVYWFTSATAAVAPTGGSKANPTYLPKATHNTWAGGFETAFTEVAPLDTNQIGRTVTTTATVSQQSLYFGRSSTAPLAAQTIPAQTWSIEASMGENNALANTYIWPVMYIWRPSNTSVVGYIMEPVDNGPGLELRVNADPRLDNNFPGQSVVVQAGDILCFELWGVATQGAATAYGQQLWTNSFNSRIVSPYVIATYVAPTGRRQRCVLFN